MPGEVAEWSIAAVLKTVELRGSGGSNPSLSASSGKIARLAFASLFFVKRSSVNLFTSGRLSNKSKSRLCRYSCYFSTCKLRSKGKGDRREPIPPPPVFQVPPVGEIDTFLHHRSGCKKASTYGKTHFAFGCGGQKARHFRMFSRVPPQRERERRAERCGSRVERSQSLPRFSSTACWRD